MEIYHKFCIIATLIASAVFLFLGNDTKAVYFLIVSLWLSSFYIEADDDDDDGANPQEET